MLISIILFVVGLLLLIKSANLLVDGASALALRLKVNPMVIGLTVVAFGTSAPELVVSVTSAATGNTGVALGNIVGSNIANILLILGISAIITPLAVHKNTVWKEIPMSFLGAIVMTILGLQYILDGISSHTFSLTTQTVIGSLTFSNGLILLSFFVIFLYYTFGIAKVTGDEKPAIKKESFIKSAILIFIGLLGLVLGSNFLVNSAVEFAKMLGVSDMFIGLTIVAVGTSIPELATSITAALKKQVELAVGNVIGSNIFNIFLILGITSLVREIPIAGQGLIDIFVLFLSTLLLFVSLFVLKRGSIGRVEGIVMLMCYFSYIGYLILRQ